jgi:apolipoprotein N-acyltransferase
MTLFNMGGTQGYLATGGLLCVVTLFAIVIDRRSFLTAGLAYFIAVMAWVTTESLGDAKGSFVVIFIIGAFFTAIGTWWVQIRARIMTALPDFPGKAKLPPYQRSEV